MVDFGPIQVWPIVAVDLGPMEVWAIASLDFGPMEVWAIVLVDFGRVRIWAAVVEVVEGGPPVAVSPATFATVEWEEIGTAVKGHRAAGRALAARDKAGWCRKSA